MGRREEEDDRFGDLVYEAWRTGHDPDQVSRDRYDGMLSHRYYPDEISLGSCIPQRGPSEEEQYYDDRIYDPVWEQPQQESPQEELPTQDEE